MLEEVSSDARKTALRSLGAQSGGVSLLPNSSTALNLAISIVGAPLSPGDLVITTDQEHPCVTWPLSRLAARGIGIVQVSGGSPAEFIDNLHEIIGHRLPRFAIFSQVSFKDGRVLPVETAGEILHEHGIPYIVDGAQALGQIPIEVPRMRAWAYAFTGHKWLFGPMGIGGLWTDERFLESNPLAWTGPVGMVRAGGGELETGTLNYGLAAGLAEALRASYDEFAARTEALFRKRARIGEFLDNIYENTAERWNGPHAPGILAYSLPLRTSPEELAMAALERFGVAIKPMRPPYEPNGFRVTFSPWTTEREIDLLKEAMHALASDSQFAG